MNATATTLRRGALHGGDFALRHRADTIWYSALLALHPRLATLAAVRASAMVGIGAVTVFVVERSHLSTSAWNRCFAAIPLGDVANCSLFAFFARCPRRDPKSHKRPMKARGLGAAFSVRA